MDKILCRKCGKYYCDGDVTTRCDKCRKEYEDKCKGVLRKIFNKSNK